MTRQALIQLDACWRTSITGIQKECVSPYACRYSMKKMQLPVNPPVLPMLAKRVG